MYNHPMKKNTIFTAKNAVRVVVIISSLILLITSFVPFFL
jgi:hypothetical protein